MYKNGVNELLVAHKEVCKNINNKTEQKDYDYIFFVILNA